jgi:hypothetical protein
MRSTGVTRAKTAFAALLRLCTVTVVIGSVRCGAVIAYVSVSVKTLLAANTNDTSPSSLWAHCQF